MSRTYALQDLHEAVSFLSDPLLRARLEEGVRVVADRVAQGDRLVTLMGGKIDALKLVSSLTLFELAALRLAASPGNQELATFATRCEQVLAVAQMQGFPRCQFTLESIRTN